jgi:hypothetical protein
MSARAKAAGQPTCTAAPRSASNTRLLPVGLIEQPLGIAICSRAVGPVRPPRPAAAARRNRAVEVAIQWRPGSRPVRTSKQTPRLRKARRRRWGDRAADRIA